MLLKTTTLHLQIYANDTDIIILAIAFFHELCSLGLSELWVSFGRGKSTVWYQIHIYANNIGVFKSKALLFFFMHSVDVTLFLLSGAKGNNHFFRHGRYFLRYLTLF